MFRKTKERSPACAARGSSASARSARRLYFQKSYQLYIMVALPILYIICFKYLPMLGTAVAFTDYNLFQGILGSDFVGFAHFKEAFASKDFWLALKNTIVLNLGDLILGFPVPIILAIFLNELTNDKIRKTTQVITYLPHFLSWVIIAGIAFQLFATTGMINNVLSALGFSTIDFLSDPTNWRIVYWVIGIWQSAGYSLIIYMAALMGMDPSLYEAAYIDGAGRFKRIWYITLPMLKPTISVLLIMNLGKIMSIGFDRPYMLGNVLVKDVSNVISTHVYSLGIAAGRFDFAAAIGLFQSVAGIILILAANKISKKFGEEGIM